MKFRPSSGTWGASLSLIASLSNVCHGIDLDVGNQGSIVAAAQNVATGLMSYYDGNYTGNTPGLLPQPYYWWEAGAMFGAMIDYWYYTGDSTWNTLVRDALLNQVGLYTAFMPPNQTQSEGNDDQGFWGIAAMMAAERGFINPSSNEPQWLELAQGVFNSQAARWDSKNCAGGLRWQIFELNNGYDYKNTISNGCFFHIAARLARYTHNDTYTKWAEKTWEWTESSGLLNPETYIFIDGARISDNCTTVDPIQWTYNAGIYLAGAAYMWNYTNGTDDAWKTRVDKTLASIQLWFLANATDGSRIIYEAACEQYGKCDVDQRSFKGYLARWLGITAVIAPWTAGAITTILQQSAQAAASTCIGGDDGDTCGFRWYVKDKWDGNWGVGEQMSALEVIQANLALTKPGPYSAFTGGNSTGNVNAGTGDETTPSPNNTIVLGPSTTGDRIGAGFLTAVCLAMILGGTFWLII